MKLVVLFGPAAVGKMTVGMSLAELTGFKLLHNNMALDLIARFFPRGSPGFSLYPEINSRIIEEAARSGAPDIIFTVVWALDSADDWALMEQRRESVERHGHAVYWVELCASQQERVRRNATPLRVREKPRQSAELTPEVMRMLDATYKLNSSDDFPLRPYLRLDVESMSPADAAEQIRTTFEL